MNRSFLIAKKIGASALVASFVFLLTPFVFGSLANAASRPSIKEVRGRQVDMVKLPIKYKKYAGKRVKIRLSVTNMHTGERWKSTHTRKLDSEGKVVLRVKELAPATVYEFRAKAKKINSGNYSESSKKRVGSTKYIGQK